MPGAYTAYIQSSPPRNFSFEITEGKGSRVTIPTNLNLSDADLTVEVSTSSAYRNPVTIGSAVFNEGNVIFSLTVSEVNTLKGGFYRIRADKGNNSYIVIEGFITYKPRAVQNNGVVDNEGNVIPGLVEPLVESLDDFFVPRSQYIADREADRILQEENFEPIVVNSETGTVDVAVLNQVMDSKLAKHVNSSLPHPAYDVDMQSLAILFENRLI